MEGRHQALVKEHNEHSVLPFCRNFGQFSGPSVKVYHYFLRVVSLLHNPFLALVGKRTKAAKI